ncbi:Transport and Golgi organization protein 1 [Trichinella papuae]|uniref:Transport and Golgi organization protein 1 n=1 Tax=Trichinella papuae TaxID=268474 RepID=A0A0V1MXC5_9BILA|nr:Transport and Golgi organization protein 1 [Trichinella papuae]
MIGFIFITVMYFYLYAYFWFATGIHPVSNESRDLQICANSNCSIQLFSSSVVEDLQLDKYFLKVNDTASVYAIGPKHLWYGNENNHIFPRSLNFTAFLKFIQTAIEEDKNLYVVDFHSRQVIRSDTARRFFTLEENVAIFRETVQDKDRFEDFLQTTLSNSTAESKAILPNLAELNANAFAIAKQRRQLNEESNVQHVDGHSTDVDVEKDEVHVARSSSSSPGVEDDDHHHHQQQQQQFDAVSNFSAVSDKEELKAEIGNASKLNETASNLSKIVENAKSEMDNFGKAVESQLKSNSVEEDASIEKNLQKLSVDNLQLHSGDDVVNGNTEEMNQIKDELKVENNFTDGDGKSSEEREELNISSSNDDHDSRSAIDTAAGGGGDGKSSDETKELNVSLSDDDDHDSRSSTVAAAAGDGKSSEEREELNVSSSDDDHDLRSSTATASGDGKSSDEAKELNVSLSDDDHDSRSSTAAAGGGNGEILNHTSVVDDANDENVEAKVEETFPEEFVEVDGEEEFAKEDSWIWQTCDKEEERCDEANRWHAADVPEMPAASTDLRSLLIRGVKFYFDQLRRAFSSIKRLLFNVDDQNVVVSQMATFSCNDLCLLILTCISLMVFVLDRLLWKRWQRKAYTSESDYVQLFSKYERMLEKLEKTDDLQEERSRVLAELKCKDAALRGVEDELRRASRELENAREGNEFLEEDLNRLRTMEAAIAEKDRQLQDAGRRCTELQEEADKLNRTHEATRQQLNERIQQLSLDLEKEKIGNEKLVAELQSLQEELAKTVELKQREGQLLAELEASKVEIHGLKEVVQRLWQCRRRPKPKRADQNGKLGVTDLEEEEALGSEGDESADGMMEAGLNLAKLYAQLAQSNDELEKMRAEVEKEHHCRLAVEAELEQLRCEWDSMKNAQQQAEMQTMEAVTRLKVLEEFFEARQKEMQKQLGMQMVISKQLEGFEDTANRLKDEKEHTEKMVKELREEVELLEKEKRKLQLQLERAQQDLWLTNRNHDRQLDALQLENKHLRDKLIQADRLDGSGVMSSSLETTNQSADAEVAAALVGMVPPEFSALLGSLPELPPPDMPPLMPPLPDLPLPTAVHCGDVNGSPALYGCEIGRTRSGYRRSKSISREEINSGSPSPDLPRRVLSSRGSVRSGRCYDYDDNDCSKLSPSSSSLRASIRHRTKDTDYNKKASTRSGEWRRKIRPPSSGDGLYSSDRSMETDASVVSPPKLAVSGVPPKGAVNSRPVVRQDRWCTR